MTRTYWLSFADDTGFLGVSIVDVTDEDAAHAKTFIDTEFPMHIEGAEWPAAAGRKAWQMKCNPGGSVSTIQLNMSNMDKALPRNRLMQRTELIERGFIDAEN